jgi:hypothetical protein
LQAEGKALGVSRSWRVSYFAIIFRDCLTKSDKQTAVRFRLLRGIAANVAKLPDLLRRQ